MIPYRNTLTNLAVGFEPTSSCSTSSTATILVNVFAYGIRVRESNPFSTYDDLFTRTPFATG